MYRQAAIHEQSCDSPARSAAREAKARPGTRRGGQTTPRPGWLRLGLGKPGGIRRILAKRSTKGEPARDPLLAPTETGRTGFSGFLTFRISPEPGVRRAVGTFDPLTDGKPRQRALPN